VGNGGAVDHQHPLNRFVCSWLTSDMADVTRCDEVLHAVAEIEDAKRKAWFVDGDAFNVDMQASGVQFNQSHVVLEDTAYWNQSEACFRLKQVSALLGLWRQYLADF
jgi:hypothetical protein